MPSTIPTASEFLRKFNSLFPPSLLGTNDSVTDEDLNACKMFDPVEFYGNKNNNHNYANSEFSRQTSDHTVRTEKDAWYSSGGAPMDDYTERTEEVPMTLREEDDGMVLIYDHTHLPLATTSSYSTTRDGRKKIHRRHARNQHKTKQQHPYKTNRDIMTTIWLLVLCIVLTMVLGILIRVLHPFQGMKTDNIITNSSNGNGNINGNDNKQTISVVPPSITDTTNDTNINIVFLIPTMAPVTTTTRTDAPVRSPSTNPRPVPITPIMEPTMVANPTAIPPVPSDNNTPDKKPPKKPTVPPLSMGPIVGHTTHNSVTLWAYHDNNDERLEILLYDSDTDVLLHSIDNRVQRKDKNNAFIETVGGLRPSTSYKFGMHIRGERVGKGSFTTAPAPPLELGLITSKGRNVANNNATTTTKTNGVQFDYVLASCMNYRQYKNQIVWDAIYDALGGRYPDFSILAGDTVYLQEGVDVTKEKGVDFDRLWFRNREQRTEEHFAEFIAHTPTYATWNDHEYGSNNANMDQKGKANSLYAWESLWANPGYGDANTDDGVYYSYYWGDVHYIVTDDHWYRDPSKDNRLGTKQTEWLKQELINSKGTFKVIVIGSDIMERGWSSDLNNIGDIVRENSVDGVLFHAGDIHRNEYKARVTGGFPYPVHQITSSGIAKVWRRPFVHIEVDTTVSDPSVTAFFYGAASTAQTTTWKNDPNLVCSSIVGTDREKEHSCTETIKLSNLRASPR